MDFPKSVPSVGLVGGKFIDEDAVAGTPGSLIPSAWGNAVTLEMLKVIEDGGLVPDEDDNTQLSVAIKVLAEAGVKFATQAQVGEGSSSVLAVAPKQLSAAIQAQAFTAFPAGGTATAVTLMPVPAIDAYAAPQRFRVQFSVASGANPTINISGRGPKNLKQYDSTGAKIAAVFAAGQLSDVEYDGTDFILRDQLPTLGNVGFQYSKLNFLVGATAMNATYAGSLSVCNSASAFGVSLPALSTMTAGQTITVWNFGAGLVTLTAPGADTISAPPGVAATYPVPQGATVVLAASPVAGQWYLESGPQATENTLGSARVATQTQTNVGADDATIVTPKKLQALLQGNALGNTQTWQDMTSGRAAATTYTNSAGRPIAISIYTTLVTNWIASITVSGVVVAANTTNNMTSGGVGTLSAIVPAGASYSFSVSTAAISKWMELR